MESIGKWFLSLLASLKPFIDPRALLMIGGSALAVRFLLPDTLKPIIDTAWQLTIAFVFAVGVSHLVRKVLLHGDFDLLAYAKKSLESPIASAVVFAAVIAFVAYLINAIVSRILP